MMTKAEKTTIVEGIKANIDKASAIFLTNVIGMTSNDAVALRKTIREANGTLKVSKNSLFAAAAKGTAAEKLLTGLKGPQAVAFAFDDAAAVAKALKETSKENELVELRGGILDGAELSVDEVVALADLPSRDEMLGTLLATFNAPISALARVLFAIQESKGSVAEESTEEVKEEAPAE